MPVISGTHHSEEDIGEGDALVGQLGNAVAHSSYWNSTAVFITLNAEQNNLMSAFDFRQAPRPAPSLPVAPADTIAFHGSGGILTDIGAPGPGRALTISLAAETSGLSLDSSATGPVSLTATAPAGVPVPARFPSSATLAGGQATVSVTFPTAGYYRIAGAGPDGSKGWVTVDAGVTPNTAP